MTANPAMRAAPLLLVLVGLAAGAARAQPQPECLADRGTLRASLNCLGMPSIPKYFDASIFRWNGHDELAVNDGNNLILWNIDDPREPVAGPRSIFGVGNMGDSDYDLMNHSICDDCRWAVATFKTGTLLFDLGTGAAPAFGERQFYVTSRDPRGAFTFEHAGQQYLLANYLPDDCGGDATLYRYRGVTSIERIACVDVPGFTGKFVQGVALEDGGSTYLYLGFYDNWIYIYEVQPVGDSIDLQFLSNSQIRAFMGRGKGLAIDKDAELAVSAFFSYGLKTWDVSSPASPVERASVAGDFGFAAMRFPFAWVATPNTPDSSKTYRLGADGAIVEELDPGFWDPAQPWNDHSDPEYGECEYPTGAVFAPDASVLFLARYSVVQAIDFSACARTDGEEPSGEEPAGAEPDAGEPDGQGPDDPGQDEEAPDGWPPPEDGATEPADTGDPAAPADEDDASSCACAALPGPGVGLAVALLLLLRVRRARTRRATAAPRTPAP